MRTMFPFNVLVRSRPIACLIRCPFYYIKERLSGCRPQIRLRIGHERKRSSAASAIGKCTTDQSLKPENRSSANRPQSVRTPAKQLRLGAEMAETFLWDWCRGGGGARTAEAGAHPDRRPSHLEIFFLVGGIPRRATVQGPRNSQPRGRTGPLRDRRFQRPNCPLMALSRGLSGRGAAIVIGASVCPIRKGYFSKAADGPIMPCGGS
jgi:hypothetical protein